MKKLTRRSDALDEICATVGFSATLSLMRWLGGSHVTVPRKMDTDCMLSAIIGRHQLNRLVGTMGGRTLWIPEDPSTRYKAADTRARDIAKMLREGASIQQVSDALGVLPYLVRRVRGATRMSVARRVAQSGEQAKSGGNLE